MERRKTERTEFWQETVDHINRTWMAKKKRSYPFTGQDFKMLKQLRTWFTAPEVLALWTCYLCRSPFWGPKSGYLISGFWQERSILLEDAEFKKLVAKYEAEFGMKSAKEITVRLGV